MLRMRGSRCWLALGTMVAMACMRGLSWRVKVRRLPRLLLAVRCMRMRLGRFVRAGGRVLVLDPAADISGCTSGFSAGEAGERLQAAVECARGAHVVLDAMTGIGVVGALRGVAGTLASSLGMDGVLPDKPALPNNDPSADLPLVVAVDARRVWVLMMVRCRGRIFLRM